MGYYTRYELQILHGNNRRTKYKLEISESTQYDDCFDDEIKWYDHKEDMLKFSLLYPNTLFLLSGEGEQQPDMWREYFKNGKTHRIIGQVEFEEFDIKELG